MVWGIFSWHTLGPLVPIEHHLNATAYLSMVAGHVHSFMTTVYPSFDSYFQQDNAPFTFTFMHLADAFIQSDLQSIQVIHFLSVCVFPGN